MKKSIKSVAAFGLIIALAACVNDPSNDGVRGGPQAVHPSPSALAQQPL